MKSPAQIAFEIELRNKNLLMAMVRRVAESNPESVSLGQWRSIIESSKNVLDWVEGE